MDQNQQSNQTMQNNASQPNLPNPPRHSSTNGFAVAGFIFAFLAPLIGLVLSIIGLIKSKNGASGQGLSIAGIVISVIMIPIWLIFSLTFISAINQRASHNVTRPSTKITKPSTAPHNLTYVSDAKIKDALKRINKTQTVKQLDDTMVHDILWKEYELDTADGSMSTFISSDSTYAVNGRDILKDAQSKYDFGTDTDLPQLKTFSKIFIQEITKYPKQSFKGLPLVGFVFVKNLRDLNDQPGPGVANKFVYLDFTTPDTYGDDYTRKAVHHEFTHLLDNNNLLSTVPNDSKGIDSTWASLNASSFSYVNPTGDVTVYNGTVSNMPSAGFVSDYAQQNTQEDKAETLSFMMTRDGELKLTEWKSSDPIIKKKVDYLLRQLDKNAPGFGKELETRAKLH